MFGFIRPSKSISKSDFFIYQSFYCGFCKSLKEQSNLVRFTTNYDITFFSIFLHSQEKSLPALVNENCILQPLKYKKIVKNDKLIKRVIDLNNLLIYYKLLDDLDDNNSFVKKIIKLYFNKYYLKSKNRESNLDKILLNNYKRTNYLQNKNENNYLIMSDVFGDCLSSCTKEILLEKFTQEIYLFTYDLGRYIYLLDAAKDIEKDFKNKNYNIFLSDNIKDIKTFKKSRYSFIEEVLNKVYVSLKNNFFKINILNYKDLLDNIVYFGLDKMKNKILETLRGLDV